MTSTSGETAGNEAIPTLKEWLAGNKLGGLETTFAQRDITDVSELTELNPSEISELGREMGLDTLQRKRFINAVKKLRQTLAVGNDINADVTWLSQFDSQSYLFLQMEFRSVQSLLNSISTAMDQTLPSDAKKCEMDIQSCFKEFVRPQLVRCETNLYARIQDCAIEKKVILKHQIENVKLYMSQLKQAGGISNTTATGSHTGEESRFSINEIRKCLDSPNVNCFAFETVPNLQFCSFNQPLPFQSMISIHQSLATPQPNITKISSSEVYMEWKGIIDVTIDKRIGYEVECSIPLKMNDKYETYLYKNGADKISAASPIEFDESLSAQLFEIVTTDQSIRFENDRTLKESNPPQFKPKSNFVSHKLHNLAGDKCYILRIRSITNDGCAYSDWVYLCIQTDVEVLSWNQRMRIDKSVKFKSSNRVRIGQSCTQQMWANKSISAKRYDTYEWEIIVHRISDSSWIGFVSSEKGKASNVESDSFLGSNQFEFAVGFSEGAPMLTRSAPKHQNSVELCRDNPPKIDTPVSKKDRFRFRIDCVANKCQLWHNDHMCGTVFDQLPQKLIPAVSNNEGMTGEYEIRFVTASGPHS